LNTGGRGIKGNGYRTRQGIRLLSTMNGARRETWFSIFFHDFVNLRDLQPWPCRIKRRPQKFFSTNTAPPKRGVWWPPPFPSRAFSQPAARRKPLPLHSIPLAHLLAPLKPSPCRTRRRRSPSSLRRTPRGQR